MTIKCESGGLTGDSLEVLFGANTSTLPFVLTDNNLLEVRLGVNKKRSLSDQSNDLVSVKFSFRNLEVSISVFFHHCLVLF